MPSELRPSASKDEHPAGLSRRRVVAGTLWAVPVVSLAAAAPAYATSGGNQALSFAASGAAVVQTSVNDVTWHDLEFSNAVVHVDGTPDPGAVLTLTVTFTPYAVANPYAAELYVLGVPAGWTSSQVNTAVATVTSTYDGVVTDGALVAIPDGIYFGPNYAAPEGSGTYVLTFSMAGLTPVVVTYDTPLPPAPVGPGARASKEPVSRSALRDSSR